MEDLSKEQRLELYKKMLKDYRISLLVPKFLRVGYPTRSDLLREIQQTIGLYTGDGLCLYCLKYTRQYLEVKFLSELYSTKPIITYRRQSAYWFKPGAIRPRIKCIKKAIELCNE